MNVEAESNFVELGFSFYHGGGLGGHTQVIRLIE